MRVHFRTCRPHLNRFYGAGDLHFVTFSCYRGQPLLGSARRRDLFLHALEAERRQYRFLVVGHVVMPEHVYLLVSEPERRNLSVVLKALKQAVARAAQTSKPDSSGAPHSFRSYLGHPPGLTTTTRAATAG